MDEMEKKEEMEQPVMAENEDTGMKFEDTSGVPEDTSGVPEDTFEAVADTETAENDTETAENDTEIVEKDTAEKGGGSLLGILIGLAALIAILAYCWMHPVGGVKDTGVLYAKANDLYFYDLKKDPYLLQEDISDGGIYHYFYNAWGAEVTENGGWVYYTANIDETGGGDLYRAEAKGGSPLWIDANVYDYQTSGDGKVVAYLTLRGDSLELCTFMDANQKTVAEGVHLEDDTYSLSENGKYLVFKDAYDMLCAGEVGGETVTLTDDCPLYALAENTLYFVARGESSYCIYSYDFKNDPELVAENAVYMELMPNGRDLLYGITPADIIPYTELLVDDMAEIDAAKAEGEEGYELKLMRDEIRAAMEAGEGIQPILQEYYVLSGGKATLAADDVVSAVAADSKKPFVTGYKAKEFAPIHLSVIGGGLEMVETIYYMSLNYGGLEPFLADGSGNLEILSGSGVLPDTVKVSFDGSHAAYLAEDAATGENVLMTMETGKAAEARVYERNVESFDFLGKTDWLGYYFDYENGRGTVCMANSSHIEDTCGVHYAEDERVIYYIEELDSETGNGDLKAWRNHDHWETIDEDVFAFQYKGNGKLVYLKNYDVLAGKGDLYYFDGTASRLLDTDVNAIFMY